MANDVFELVGSAVEGKYRVDRAVGEGGFGVVYQGHHLGFDAPIALKCLKIPSHFTPAAETVFFTRFREEGKLLLKLSGEHLSILRVFDFGVARSEKGAQFPYLVMEWLEGNDLQQELRERQQAGKPPYAELEALRLLRPAIEALAVAHREGVAHRDIKPENLFLVRSDRGVVVKVLDFGIAKVMQEGETATQLGTKTSSGFRAFSPRHGAPEQFSTKRYGPTGPWTDVHALGLILVEMVTGQPALEGEELVDVFDSAIAERRPTPRLRGAKVSDPFEAMCGRALACLARDRFRSAGDLLDAVDGVLAGNAAVEWATPTVPEGPPEMTGIDPAGSLAEGRTEQVAVPSDAEAPARTPPKAPASTRDPAEPAPARAQPGGGAHVIGAAPEQARRAATSPSPRSRVPLVAGSVAVAAVAAGGLWAASSRGPSSEGVAPTATATGTVEVHVGRGPGTAPSARVSRMIAVPAGSFMMGADSSPDEKPVHSVQVAAFEMDETEVTVADYKACVESGACQEPDIGIDCNWGKRDRAEHPVNCVSFRDAAAYCGHAKKRLPTEEEWEYAARGVAATKYPWGNREPPREEGAAEGALCWRRHVGEGTCKVGSFDAGKSPLGIHDLAGNVWEWTSSRFCPYSSKQCTRETRVYRGGAWLSSSPESVLATNRQKDEPASRSSVVGFRCARGGA